MNRILLWVGGGPNLASNPYDWAPQEAPGPGDTLYLLQGTMAVVDKAIKGALLDRIHAGTDANATIYMDGKASMQLLDQGSGIGTATTNATFVNIDYLSRWVGTFTTNPFGHNTVQGYINPVDHGQYLTIQGDGVFQDNGPSLIDNYVTIETPIIGGGSLAINASHLNATLEVTNSVAPRISMFVGGSYADNFGTLTIDAPEAYHAATELSFGEIILKGLETASSYELAGGDLSLFNADGDQVYAMRLVLDQLPEHHHATDFGVSQTSAGINVHADGPTGDWSAGTLLPVHC